MLRSFSRAFFMFDCEIIEKSFRQRPTITPSKSMENKTWFKDVQNMMEKYPAPTPDKPEEHTGLLFTNFSPHYDGENESSPNEYLTVIPLYAKYPMPNPVFGEMLLKAVQNYGYVPNIVEDK